MLKPLAAAATLAVAFAAVAAGTAEQSRPLGPMAFLAGHCWKAPFPDGKSTDTHCFEWIHGGQQLRDRHEVRAQGESTSQYQGETLYLWDAGTSRIIYRYVDSTGGHSDGHVEPGKDVLNFPADVYVGADGKQINFVTEWRRLGDTSYEARTRQKVGDTLRDVFVFRFSREE